MNHYLIISLFDYLITELDYLSGKILSLDVNNINLEIYPTVGHGIYWTKPSLPSDLVNKFQVAALLLEQESLRGEKFHIGSKNIQLDLIHPSNYCLLAYDRSLILLLVQDNLLVIVSLYLSRSISKTRIIPRSSSGYLQIFMSITQEKWSFYPSLTTSMQKRTKTCKSP